jgi:uncharacterized protein with ParB-like and HNH nuclease domain
MKTEQKSDSRVLPLHSASNSFNSRSVKYQLNQLKIEQLVGYFNDEVIDLTPPFQRGRVWSLKMRQSLLKNILQGKPVPAIFLYKTPVGAKNNYVILDGKQRLESILLYIGAQRNELKIEKWHSYIFGKADRNQVHFKANVNGKLKDLKGLADNEAVKFRDYSLSIIEIDFDEEITLDEIIQLFVDINQSGIKVKRFDIVKALYLDDPLLKQVFELIAVQQERGADAYFKAKNTPYSAVLKKLDVVNRLEESQNRVDMMWEKLCEFALFTASGLHRKPSQILKDFISRKGTRQSEPRLSVGHLQTLRNVFLFLSNAYRKTKLVNTRWATDQTHFYIMITALINDVKRAGQQSLIETLPPELIHKLIKFDTVIKGQKLTGVSGETLEKVKMYMDLSAKQTTDISKRQDREKLFREIVHEI